jgi:TonB family protein
MRHLIATALVVSPLMLNAQMATSAPNPHISAMQSSVTVASNAMMSSASASPADRTQAIPAMPRVSTGVIEPKLIHTVAIHQDTVGVVSLGRNQRSATVSMMVDEDGKPTDLNIMKSAGPDLDPSILEAVSQYRFQPATVSGQKTAMALNLNMDIELAQ